MRGLSPHNASVCNSENSIAASRPLQTDPEPESFFRPNTGPRSDRSAVLLSIGTSGCSTNTVSPGQWCRRLSSTFRRAGCNPVSASSVSRC